MTYETMSSVNYVAWEGDQANLQFFHVAAAFIGSGHPESHHFRLNGPGPIRFDRSLDKTRGLQSPM